MIFATSDTDCEADTTPALMIIQSPVVTVYITRLNITKCSIM